MKLIDITVDLETCSTTPNAAIMQLAAVAWDRNHDDSATFLKGARMMDVGVDLRTAVMDGFDFEPSACRFWHGNKQQAKDAVLSLEAHSLKDVIEGFVKWIDDVRQDYCADAVCLWAQGSDFDIAIVRNALAKYGLRLPMSQEFLRDARSICLEIGAHLLRKDDVEPDDALCDMKTYEDKIYNALTFDYQTPDVLADGCAHDALYDARRTAFSTWCALRTL